MHIGSISHLLSTTPLKERSTVVPLETAENTEVSDHVSFGSSRPTGEKLSFTMATQHPSSALQATEIETVLPTVTAEPPAKASAPGFDLSNLDRTTSPTADFYQFAMGGYLASKPIPADRERFGVDAEITIRNDVTVKEILNEMAAGKFEHGTIEQKLGDFFKAGMNVDAIEKAGLSPIKADLDRIDAISSPADLAQEIKTMHAEGNSVYFSFYGTTDSKEATQVIGEFSQGGLSLPEPEYYTSEDNKETLEKYEAHVTRMFELSGIAPEQAKRDARSVVELETRLAKISLSTADRRDPEMEVNKKSLSELGKMSGAFEWADYLKSQKADGQPNYNVTTPKFFENLEQVNKETSLEAHKAYLRWHLLSSNATELPAAFDKENFNFYSKTLDGVPEQKPRVERIARATDNILGEALGVKFVERRFSSEAKASMNQMIDAFKDALRDRVSQLSWMGPETRKGALAKIDTLASKIGYPDHPNDYKELDIGDSYLENVRNSNRYQRDRNLGQIGKPVDKSEWGMTASTNNAYYQPTNNEICFPAGILQPPYFDASADPAFNFGGIGATIGHELGHGFDDQGAQYDPQGNLNNWMTPEDLEKFKKKAEGVEKQFDEYVIEGLPVNGKLVLGEAMADLSGLELAYVAYKIATKDQEPEVINGFTPDQRFFLAYAQSWATNVRPEYAKKQIKTDPHPHPKLRVNATLANMTPFFNAFGVQPGQPMRRVEEKRNEIWT